MQLTAALHEVAGKPTTKWFCLLPHDTETQSWPWENFATGSQPVWLAGLSSSPATKLLYTFIHFTHQVYSPSFSLSAFLTLVPLCCSMIIDRWVGKKIKRCSHRHVSKFVEQLLMLDAQAGSLSLARFFQDPVLLVTLYEADICLFLLRLLNVLCCYFTRHLPT
jgi:hypothetical protein